MSDLFAMADPAADAKLAAAAANSVDSLSDIEAPWYRGAVSGLGQGVVRGVANLNDLLLTGTDLIYPMSDEEREQQQFLREHALDAWTPRANEVGRVGQVLGSLGELAAPLAVGGAPLLVGSTTLAGGKRLVDEGVDARTAGTAAAIEGATAYAGLKVPILGESLATRLASGAAGNLAFGAGARAGEKALLESQGYEDQAKPFTTDLASISTDALTGLLFGGLHHTFAPGINPKLTPSQADAVLTARNAKNFQEATAPGAPDDIRSNVASQDAAADTLERLSRGERVDVGDVVARNEGASFTPDGKIEASLQAAKDIEAAQIEDAQQEWRQRDENLEIATRPKESVQSATEAEAPGYSVAEGELTDEQLATFQGLRSDVQADQNDGGTVGGKPASEGARDAGRSGAQAAGAPLTVFRGSEQPLAAEHFAPEALGHASGHPSSGLGVFFTNDRADAQGYGPHVEESHLDIRNPKVFKIEDFPDFDSIEEATAFRKKLEAAGHDGIVIDMSHLGGPTQYVAFEHRQVSPAARKTAPREQARAAASTPKAEAAPAAPPTVVAPKPVESAAPKAVDVFGDNAPPHVAALRQLAAERPDAPVYSGYDADGQPVKSTIGAEYKRIQREYEREIEDTKAYDAAVTCFLGRGA